MLWENQMGREGLSLPLGAREGTVELAGISRRKDNQGGSVGRRGSWRLPSKGHSACQEVTVPARWPRRNLAQLSLASSPQSLLVSRDMLPPHTGRPAGLKSLKEKSD